MKAVLLILALAAPATALPARQDGPRHEASALAAELDPTRLERALALAVDEDDAARAAALDYLSQVELESPEDREARVAALRQRATIDPDAELRRRSLEGLGALGGARAAEVLVQLARELPPVERRRAARQLAEVAGPLSRAAREVLEAAVLGSFGEREDGLPGDALAVLLPSYGRRLAERAGGGDLPRERAPFVLGARHPSPAVRGAGARALELFLARLRQLGQFDRADRAIARLAADGVPTRPLTYLRVLGDLEQGGTDHGAILASIRRLRAAGGGGEPAAEGHWRARAVLLEGVALLAFERLDGAQEAFGRAADLYDGLLARRIDRAGPLGADTHRDLYQERALVEFSEAFRRLAAGTPGDDPDLLGRLRRAHALQLTAQEVAVGHDLATSSGPDPFFELALSPYRLVLARVPHAAWPPERQIRLQREMGRALASVLGRELPGFEPYPDVPAELFDPVLDGRRALVLMGIARAELEAMRRRYEELRLRELRAMKADPALEREIELTLRVLSRVAMDLGGRTLDERYLDLRTPSAHALDVAERMRREGRTAACRELATRFAEDLRALQLVGTMAVPAAHAQLVIGGSWSDEGRPAKAEEHLLEALALLEGLRSEFEERRDLRRVAAVDDEIAEALVSLAVNANVKAGDPERAREYFERAYELRQDDFMRVLLACYRARSGREEEARELLVQVPASPGAYYNLACTHALLGDTQEALDYLERDFSENRTSEAALEKQKEWARGDPDLASLREDPRFQLLTAPAPPPEVQR